VRGRDGMHIERINIAEFDTAEELETAPGGGQRTQFWMDREPGEVRTLAEPDPAYEMALALVEGRVEQGATRRDGLVRKVLRRLRGRGDGAR